MARLDTFSEIHYFTFNTLDINLIILHKLTSQIP